MRIISSLLKPTGNYTLFITVLHSAKVSKVLLTIHSSSNTWTLPADRDARALNNLDKYSLTSSLGDDKRLSIPLYKKNKSKSSISKILIIHIFFKSGFHSPTRYKLVAPHIYWCTKGVVQNDICQNGYESPHHSVREKVWDKGIGTE